MSLTLFSCDGGELRLSDRGSLMLSREDGGHLIVVPPRVVWERSELTPAELTQFGFLVAAAGRAMIDVLPQLEGGCINYFEAGNWALNDQAEPKGRKTARAHRQMHLHLLGRSPSSTSPFWQWGEAPRLPAFAERETWGRDFEPLTPDECRRIVERTRELLRTRYGLRDDEIRPWSPCPTSGYPMPVP